MTTSPSHDKYKYKDQKQLNALTNLVAQNIDAIYTYFNTDQSYKNNTLITSPCFIHGGDNTTALNLYYNADIRVHYKCRTHQCEENFGSSLISLVRGGLSRTKYNWKIEGDKEASFNETIEFLLNFTKQDYGKISGENLSLDEDKLKFSSLINNFIIPETQNATINADLYRSKVEIPATYYLQRGYSIEILDKYDVGTCTRPTKFLYQRAVVPIYDELGENIL